MSPKNNKNRGIILPLLAVLAVVGVLFLGAIVFAVAGQGGVDTDGGGGGGGGGGNGNTNDIIRIAESQLTAWEGDPVHEIPNGANRGDGVDKFFPVGTTSAQWCAFFATWVLNQAGYQIPRQGHSKTLLDWFRDNRVMIFRDNISATNSPQPGDIVVWDRDGQIDPELDLTGAGHTGIVVSVSYPNFNTIEGNISNQVGRRSHNVNESTLIGFGRFK